MRLTLTTILFLFFLVSAYSQSPSKSAKKYLDKVFKIIEDRYIYIDSINIPALKEKCYPLISNALSRKDTYQAIDTLLTNLFDHHHIFWRPEQFTNPSYFGRLTFPVVELLNESIGYIKIPPIVNQYNQWQLWIDTLQNSMNSFKSHSIKGWIIDLRGNYGGDLPPMITSLYPFLGDTIIYTLKDRNNNSATYRFSLGYYTLEKKGKTLKILPYNKKLGLTKNAPVSILIDSKTASAAEMVAIAFKGRSNTIFLGEPTAGLTIGTDGFTLADNAFFTIATGRFYDSKGISYEHSINPDIFIKQEPNKEDKTKQMAIDWLLKQ